MTFSKKNLIWIDLEMTGLNPQIHRILEIATVITDTHLNIITEGPIIPIYQNQENISKMNHYVKKMHTKNGLIQRVEKSIYNEKQAETETIFFLKKLVPIQSSPMCGNSVGQDRRFLSKYMPKLENYFHYRCIDVSSIKELAIRWKPKIYSQFKKKNKHTAREDIYESIMELDFYRKNFLKF